MRDPDFDERVERTIEQADAKRKYPTDSVTEFMHPSAPEPVRHWDISDLS